MSERERERKYVVNGIAGTAGKENVAKIKNKRLSLTEVNSAFREWARGGNINDLESILSESSKKRDRVI